MKNSLLLLLTVLLAAVSSYAQTPPFYNALSTSNNSFPLQSITSNKVQWVYVPGIFSSTGGGTGTPAYFGLIDTIWIRSSGSGASGTPSFTGLEVSLGQNVGTQSIFTSGTFLSGLSTGFGPASYISPVSNAAGNWLPIPLSTPFLYNPALSLVVEVKQLGYVVGWNVSPDAVTSKRIFGGHAATSGSVASGLADLGLSMASNLSCATPSLLNITNVGQTTLNLGWTDNNTPAATTWQIEYGAAGFFPTGIPNVITTTNPHTFNGLLQNTSYDFYVRSYCGANDTSYYAATSATTLAQCPWPTNLTASNITSSSVDMNWTENGIATNWGIEIGLQGFSPTGIPTVTTTTKPYTFGGLPDLFTFDYYVRSICGPGDTSILIGPYTFTVCGPLSGNFTIDSTFPTNGTNFQSFAEAINRMSSCGVGGPVVFSVKNAINNEQLTLTPIAGMSATNTVTFNGHGTATLTQSRTTTPYHTLLLNDADYFIFDSMKIRAMGTVGFAAQLFNGASNNQFNNCTLEVTANSTSTLLAPFVSSGSLTSATTAVTIPSNNNKIENSILKHGYYSVTLMGSATNVDTNNQIINCKFEDFYLYGLYTQNQIGLSVRRNEISRPTRTSFSTFNGIYAISSTMLNCVFDRNHLHDPFGATPTNTASACYPIYILGDATSTATANIVSNNLIEDIKSNTTIYGIYIASANYIKVYHNTISLDNTAATGTGAVRAIYQTGSTTAAVGQDFRNNLISVTQGGTGAKFGIYLTQTLAANMQCSNNNVYGTPSATYNYGYNGGNRLDLAAWQLSSPAVGAGSSQLNPLFANPALNDYKPTNPFLDNKGTALGILNDFLGLTRSLTVPDVGAFEFSPACPAPSSIAASNVTSTSLNLSWQENGTATVWDIERVAAGAPPTGIPTYTNVATNINYLVTGLTQYQSYDFYVRAICGGTNGNSIWSGPYTVISCAPLAGTYTINATLPTSATNFQSFGAVAIALNCGITAPVVFNVNNAIYTQQVIFPQVPGASATNTITFNGNGATIQSTTSAANYSVIRLDGSDYFRFNNLTVKSLSTTTSFAMHLFNTTNGTNQNKFSNCTFEVPITATSSNTASFVMSGSLTSASTAATVEADSNIIDSCTIRGGYYGLAWYGPSSSVNNGNQVKNTNIEDFYVYGTYILYENEFLFKKNDISRATRTTLSTCYGVYCGSGAMSNAVFEENYLHDFSTANQLASFTGYLMYFLQDASSVANSNIVRNNIIVDKGGDGAHFGIALSTANNIKVYHNTISFEATATPLAGENRGISQVGTGAVGQDIQNNIINMAGSSNGLVYGIYLESPTVNCDYNAVYGNMTNYNFGYNGGAAQTNLAAWQASVPNVGDSSLSFNPVFTSTYSPGNILIDGKGNALGIMNDYYGNARSVTNPDMGAVEFSISCAAPTNLTATNITSNSFNLSWQENGTATLWDIEVKPAGTPATGIPDSVGVTNNINFPFTGLPQYSAYDIYVRSVCGGANGNSVWNGPYTVLVCTPLAGTYTINASAPASATNFQSFNAVVTALGCGISAPVVFNVVAASGPYNEQVIFGEVNGASATNTITFNGNGETISFATTATNYSVIRLDGSDWFRFNNLTVTSPSTASCFGMHLVNVGNATNNNIIKKCNFLVSTTVASSTIAPFAMSGSYTSATATMITKADSNIIDSCIFEGGYYGVTMYGKTTAPYSTGNQLKNSIIRDFYNYGLYSAYQDGLIVSGNELSRPTRTASTSCYPLYQTGIANNQIWEKNYLHNMFDGMLTSTSLCYYMYMLQDAGSAANSNIIRNNIIDDNNGGNAAHYLIFASTAENLKIYHNTLVMRNTTGTGATMGIYQTGTAAAGQDIQNNIVVNASAGTGIKHGIYLESTSVNCDYNNVFTSSTTGTNYYGFNGANRADLTAWKASTPTVGQNSTDVNPMFTNPAPNYTPSNPLINGTGNILGIVEDYLGNSRSPVNPDMGAFEFAVASTDMALNLIASPNPSSGCYSSTQTVSVQISNAGSTPHNFVTNPMTITLNVTGAVTSTLTATINTGTLATFATQTVSLTPTLNMSASGNYTLSAYSSTMGDAILFNDTMAPLNYTVNLSAGTATASPDVHCVSGNSTINLVGSSGGNIQWQEATSGSGPWSNVGTNTTSYNTGTLASTRYYRATVSCNANVVTSNVDTVIVNNPTFSSIINDTICGPNSATLIAIRNPTTSTGVNWYDVPTGGTKLDTGAVFHTPMLTMSDTFYAEAIAGGGAIDSFGIPIGGGNTTGINYHMTAINALTNMSISGINVVTSSAVNTIVAFDVYYRMGNYINTPGANTSAVGWINIGTLNGVSKGTAAWTSLDFPISIPAAQGQSVSFHIVPSATPVPPAVAGVCYYTTGFTAFSVIYSNADIQIISGQRGSTLFNCTTTGGSPKFQVKYSTGCPSTRTPVIAVVNPGSGDLALATSTNASSTPGVDSLNDMQPDGATVNYFNPNCNLIAKIVDAPGGNILGQVTSKVNVDATVNVWNGQPYARRWYDINVASNGPATVTLYYTQADFNDYNAHPSVLNNTYGTLPTSPAGPTTNIRITKISGGGLGVGTVTGVITPTTVWNATAMRWEMTFPVTAFSQFFLHAANPSNAALSVNLGDFTVVKNGGVSDASWYTLMEENNSHFNVQRSTHGRTFNQIGKVYTQASGGNSNEKLSYSFTDEQPQIGHNYYRLEQVDQDGKMSYSNIIDLVWGADGSVVSVYPNPATDKLNIDVSIDKVTQMEVRLLDMSGRVVKSAMLRTVKGMNNVTLNLSDVASGVYGVQIFDNNNLIHTAKVNKQSR